MKSKTLLWAALVALALSSVPATIVATSGPATAQDYRDMSCRELWYARNQIYADKGYCFQTDRARRAFGRGCFPPYGRLSGWEAEEVERIKRWEGRRGCR